MKIGELFVELGVNADTGTVAEFGRAIGNLPLEAAAAIGALAGLTFKIKDIIMNGIDGAVSMEKFALRTGLSAQALSKWQVIGEQANVSAQDMAASIESLQRNLAEIKLGRGNIAPFQILGVSAAGDAFSVLQQLRQRVKNLPSATATNLISQMGLSPDMIKVLRLSDAEFERFGKTARGMTEEQERAFLKVKLAATQMGLVFRDFVWTWLSHIVDGFDMFYEAISRVQGAIPLLITLVGVLGAAFFPVTAAVVGLLLVLEDLAVYAKGGKSLFGTAMEALTGRKITPQGYKDSVDTLRGTDAATIGKTLADFISGGTKNVGAVDERAYVSPSQFKDKVSHTNQTLNITQHINGDNAKETGDASADAVKRAANDASLQIPTGD